LKLPSAPGKQERFFFGYYLGTPVAIKKLFVKPSDADLIQREFAMLRTLRHPNIVQFLGLCIHETGIYLVSEYVEHGDLVDLLVFAKANVSWADRVKIALQTAQALLYMHTKNVIHRDVKGLNILVGDNFKVKVCDLGLATTMNKQRGSIVGTNLWMAPEVSLGEPYSKQVDVFSFGVVLTEIITAAAPLPRKEKFQFNVERFLSTVPPSCPPAFAELVVECTKTNPAERPDFKTIVAKLRAIHSELS